MTIQDWGAVGELISGVAVLITLVYLAFQIRQNTSALRAQTRAEVSQHAVDHLLTPVNRETLGEIILKSNSDVELSGWESQQLHHYYVSLLRRWENFHYQYRMGLFDESEFTAHQEVWRRTIRNRPMFVAIWRDGQREVFSPEFADELERIIRETDA